MAEVIRGRVWKFGDDINTDLLIPGHALQKSEAEQLKHCFSANRPGWVELVQQGDLIVGGRNFGTGSSRPGARVLRQLGISCLLANSINGLFLRNCVNFGLPAFSCEGIWEDFDEGDIAEVTPRTGEIRIVTKSIVRQARPLPEMLFRIIEAGGMIPLLRAEGYLE